MTRTDLPGMDPEFVAATIEALPNRLKKRLQQADPDTWTVTGNTVQHGNATVTLTPPDGATCDCLLSPRCLHVAQVLMECPATEADPQAETERDEEQAPGPEPAGEATGGTELTDNQVAVLERAETVLMGVLDRGLAGLTATDRAGVLRVVAGARVQRLPLLASSFANLLGRVGDRVTELAVSALVDAALATHRLRHGHATQTVNADIVGTARRTYEHVGNLRLRGWACEPVLTVSGYAGVVTYLVDERDGGVWTLSSVVPGDQSQIAQAYRGDTGLSELSLSHHDLARGGLLLTGATASADRRLGKGSGVRASTRTPDESAVPAEGWWHGEAILGGVEDNGLHPVFACETENGPLRCGISTVVEHVGAQSLRVLASAPGTQVHVRVRARRPEEPGNTQWVLVGVFHKDTWVFPGLDNPDVHWLGAPRDAAPVTVTSAVIEPATVVRRWRDAVARHGRRAVTGAGRDRLMDDVAWLRAHASGHRATLLEQLAEAGAAGEYRFDGNFQADPRDLPRRWTALAAVC